MTPDLMLAFASYAFVISITPGPNNTMLLASGANFGFRRSLPHLIGVNLGSGVMILAVGFGAGTVFTLYPALYLVLKLAGGLYLLYLAWLIATAAPLKDGASVGTPMTFLGAAAFQWVNPKAWIVAVGAISTYVPADGAMRSVALVTLIYLLVNAPCISIWTGFGVAVRRWLSQPAYLRVFNLAMAAILLMSLAPIAADLVAQRDGR